MIAIIQEIIDGAVDSAPWGILGTAMVAAVSWSRSSAKDSQESARADSKQARTTSADLVESWKSVAEAATARADAAERRVAELLQITGEDD